MLLEEPKVKSSATAFQRFIESTVWDDMKNEMMMWLEGARDGMEDTDAGADDLYRNQGRADACRRFMSLPIVMRDGVISESKPKKEENDA